MSKVRIYARNLAANWIGYWASLALTLVSSWFVFHLLGDVRYGIWCLMLSLTGYLGIVDLGLRPALYRYYNWYLGRGEPEKVNEVLCTALAFFVAACLVLLLAGTVLGFFFGQIFPKAPPEYLGEVGIALVFTALDVGLSGVAASFRSLIDTRERYDLSSGLETTVIACRSAASILVIYLGFGLVGLAVAHVGVTALSCAGGYMLARRAFHPMAIRRSHVSRRMLTELLRFGVPCFFSGIGIRVMAFTSPPLIAWLIGISAVGYYSLAVMMLEYGRSLVQKTATIFTPSIQQAVARDDLPELRRFVPVVTRLFMGASVLVIVGIMALGQDFLRLFYGEAAGAATGGLLAILGVGHLFACSSLQCGVVLIAAAKVRFMASIVLVQAAASLGLIVILVALGHMGLLGVALGTAAPMVLFSGILISMVGIGHMRMRWTQFARQTAAHWIPAAALFLAACFGLAYGIAFATWGWFFAKVTCACLVYVPIAWFIILPPEHRKRLLAWVSGPSSKWRKRPAGSVAPAVGPSPNHVKTGS